VSELRQRKKKPKERLTCVHVGHNGRNFGIVEAGFALCFVVGRGEHTPAHILDLHAVFVGKAFRVPFERFVDGVQVPTYTRSVLRLKRKRKQKLTGLYTASAYSY
jgi:hypothetical protein